MPQIFVIYCVLLISILQSLSQALPRFNSVFKDSNKDRINPYDFDYASAFDEAGEKLHPQANIKGNSRNAHIQKDEIYQGKDINQAFIDAESHKNRINQYDVDYASAFDEAGEKIHSQANIEENSHYVRKQKDKINQGKDKINQGKDINQAFNDAKSHKNRINQYDVEYASAYDDEVEAKTHPQANIEENSRNVRKRKADIYQGKDINQAFIDAESHRKADRHEEHLSNNQVPKDVIPQGKDINQAFTDIELNGKSDQNEYFDKAWRNLYEYMKDYRYDDDYVNYVFVDDDPSKHLLKPEEPEELPKRENKSMKNSWDTHDTNQVENIHDKKRYDELSIDDQPVKKLFKPEEPYTFYTPKEPEEYRKLDEQSGENSWDTDDKKSLVDIDGNVCCNELSTDDEPVKKNFRNEEPYTFYTPEEPEEYRERENQLVIHTRDTDERNPSKEIEDDVPQNDELLIDDKFIAYRIEPYTSYTPEKSGEWKGGILNVLDTIGKNPSEDEDDKVLHNELLSDEEPTAFHLEPYTYYTHDKPSEYRKRGKQSIANSWNAYDKNPLAYKNGNVRFDELSTDNEPDKNPFLPEELKEYQKRGRQSIANTWNAYDKNPLKHKNEKVFPDKISTGDIPIQKPFIPEDPKEDLKRGGKSREILPRDNLHTEDPSEGNHDAVNDYLEELLKDTEEDSDEKVFNNDEPAQNSFVTEEPEEYLKREGKSKEILPRDNLHTEDPSAENHDAVHDYLEDLLKDTEEDSDEKVLTNDEPAQNSFLTEEPEEYPKRGGKSKEIHPRDNLHTEDPAAGNHDAVHDYLEELLKDTEEDSDEKVFTNDEPAQNSFLTEEPEEYPKRGGKSKEIHPRDNLHTEDPSAGNYDAVVDYLEDLLKDTEEDSDEKVFTNDEPAQNSFLTEEPEEYPKREGKSKEILPRDNLHTEDPSAGNHDAVHDYLEEILKDKEKDSDEKVFTNDETPQNSFLTEEPEEYPKRGGKSKEIHPRDNLHTEDPSAGNHDAVHDYLEELLKDTEEDSDEKVFNNDEPAQNSFVTEEPEEYLKREGKSKEILPRDNLQTEDPSAGNHDAVHDYLEELLKDTEEDSDEKVFTNDEPAQNSFLIEEPEEYLKRRGQSRRNFPGDILKTEDPLEGNYDAVRDYLEEMLKDKEKHKEDEEEVSDEKSIVHSSTDLFPFLPSDSEVFDEDQNLGVSLQRKKRAMPSPSGSGDIDSSIGIARPSTEKNQKEGESPRRISEANGHLKLNALNGAVQGFSKLASPNTEKHQKKGASLRRRFEANGHLKFNALKDAVRGVSELVRPRAEKKQKKGAFLRRMSNANGHLKFNALNDAVQDDSELAHPSAGKNQKEGESLKRISDANGHLKFNALNDAVQGVSELVKNLVWPINQLLSLFEYSGDGEYDEYSYDY